MSKFESYREQINKLGNWITPRLPDHVTPFLADIIAFDHKFAAHELDKITVADHTTELFPRHFVVFVVATTLNIIDDAVEADPDGIPEASLEDYAIGNISIHNLNAFLTTVQEVTPVPNLAILEHIINWQKWGMTQIRACRESNAILYNVQDAISYRQNTLGNYFSFLAGIGLIGRSSDEQSRFTKELLIAQRADDERDLDKDLWTQVTPQIALLSQHNLLHLIRANMTLDSILYREPEVYKQPNRGHIVGQGNRIREAYEKLPPYSW